MNKAEHHLVCLGEEAVEIAKEVSKALRFGLSEIMPGQELTNARRIINEVKDLISVLKIISEYDGRITGWQPTLFEVEKKREKIEKFMKISRREGVLSDD